MSRRTERERDDESAPTIRLAPVGGSTAARHSRKASEAARVTTSEGAPAAPSLHGVDRLTPSPGMISCGRLSIDHPSSSDAPAQHQQIESPLSPPEPAAVLPAKGARDLPISSVRQQTKTPPSALIALASACNISRFHVSFQRSGQASSQTCTSARGLRFPHEIPRRR